MNTYPTKLAELFAAKALQRYYSRSVAEFITNQDYEGQVEEKGSILNILTFGAILSADYDGTDMTSDDLSESNAQLKTDQAKRFYFRVKSWDKFRSYIKNPEGTILDQVANELKKVIDKYILQNFYTDVAAGQRLGTDYVTGTVTITTVTGAVVGSGTTFTASMVGKGFKADGHSAYYRVKTFTDTTHITIEDDSDDLTSAYTGGAISGGTSYAVQANTAVQVTKSNVFDYFNKLSEFLTNAEVPEEDRWATVPPQIYSLIKESSDFQNNTESGRQAGVIAGKVGQFAGFDIYQVPQGRMQGDSVNGWHIMGGHRSFITFAMGMTENGVEDAIGNFGKKYKSLYVYGAKVADERRKAGVELFGKL